MKRSASDKMPGTTMQSPILWCAALLSLAAVLLAVPGIPAVFSAEAHAKIIKDLYNSGVGGNAVMTWFYVDLVLRLGALLLPGALAVCLFAILLPQLCGKTADASRGLALLRGFCQALRYGFLLLSGYFAVMFVYRATAYIIRCWTVNHGVFLIFGMVFYECILAALMGLALYFLIRTLAAACDTADALRYTALTGKPDAVGIHTGVMTMLWVMGILGMIVGLTRLPAREACLNFQCASWALCLLAIFLRRFRRKMERTAYHASRKIAESEAVA